MILLMTYGPLAGVWRDTIIIERRRPDDLASGRS
jgi:hypothetical protein